MNSRRREESVHSPDTFTPSLGPEWKVTEPASAMNETWDSYRMGRSFRFLDRLVSLEPGVSGVGEFTLQGTERFCGSHFPGGSHDAQGLMLESAAWWPGWWHQSDQSRLRCPDSNCHSGGKILGTARPGELIVIHARITGRMGHLIQAQATATLRERCCCGAVTLAGARRGGSNQGSPGCVRSRRRGRSAWALT